MESPSESIDKKIKELGDWRGQTLAKVREIVHKATPEIVAEWNWMGTPVWSHGGIVCTGEMYKKAVKMTFASSPQPREQEQAKNRANEQQAHRLDVSRLLHRFSI